MKMTIEKSRRKTFWTFAYKSFERQVRMRKKLMKEPTEQFSAQIDSRMQIEQSRRKLISVFPVNSTIPDSAEPTVIRILQINSI